MSFAVTVRAQCQIDLAGVSHWPMQAG